MPNRASSNIARSRLGNWIESGWTMRAAAARPGMRTNFLKLVRSGASKNQACDDVIKNVWEIFSGPYGHGIPKVSKEAANRKRRGLRNSMIATRKSED